MARFTSGGITGNAVYVKSSSDRSNLRRTVSWNNEDWPVDFADLPDALAARLSSQHTIVDLTNEISSLRSCWRQPRPMRESADQGHHEPVPAPAQASLPDATEELAERLLVDRLWIQEQIELLRDRRQLIFYGPPGTGKTYLAKEIADHLTGSRCRQTGPVPPPVQLRGLLRGLPSGTVGTRNARPAARRRHLQAGLPSRQGANPEEGGRPGLIEHDFDEPG